MNNNIAYLLLEKRQSIDWGSVDKTFPRTNPGVYCIFSLTTGMAYIGRSSNLFGRKASHIKMLDKNSHPNYRLQYEYNNGSDMKYFVIETCNSELSTKILECYWASVVGSDRLLNIGSVALSFHVSEATHQEVSLAASFGFHPDDNGVVRAESSIRISIEDIKASVLGRCLTISKANDSERIGTRFYYPNYPLGHVRLNVGVSTGQIIDVTGAAAADISNAVMAAYNACHEINPNNPAQAAAALPDVMEALRHISKFSIKDVTEVNYVIWLLAYSEIASRALEKMTGNPA